MSQIGEGPGGGGNFALGILDRYYNLIEKGKSGSIFKDGGFGHWAGYNFDSKYKEGGNKNLYGVGVGVMWVSEGFGRMMQSNARGDAGYGNGSQSLLSADCKDCINPASIGNNLLGLTYPGGDNPKTNGGDYSYSYVPKNLSEYPAIGHDRRYDKLGVKGASGLFTDRRAIGADWRFVGEELLIANNLLVNPIDRVSAGILGIGLGLSSLPKTLVEFNSPKGIDRIIMWYYISNQGVNNIPSIHKH